MKSTKLVPNPYDISTKNVIKVLKIVKSNLLESSMHQEYATMTYTRLNDLHRDDLVFHITSDCYMCKIVKYYSISIIF